MKTFAAETTYSHTAAEVRAAESEEGFVDFLAERLSGELGGEIRSKSVVNDGGRTTVTVVFYVPSSTLPAPAKMVIGDGVEATLVLRWLEQKADGSLPGELEVTSRPSKATIRSSFVQSDTETGSTRAYTGELTVHVPLVGGRVEGEAVKRMDRIVGFERRFVEEYIASKGS